MKLVVLILYLSLGCVLSDSSIENKCRNYIRKIQKYQDRILSECSAVVDCGEPESIANGSVNFTSTALNSTAVHTCDDGYLFVGDEFDQQIVCLVTETWLETRGTCEILVDAECPYNTAALEGAYGITSSTYVNDLECLFTIVSPDTTRPRQVTINFEYFDVENFFDDLTITVDGVSEVFSGDLGAFTLTYTTTGDIDFFFDSDFSITGEGFAFGYETIFEDELR